MRDDASNIIPRVVFLAIWLLISMSLSLSVWLIARFRLLDIFNPQLFLLTTINNYLTSASAAQRFALPALGRGRRSRPARKMKRRMKLPEIAAESPASGARFVGLCYF